MVTKSSSADSNIQVELMVRYRSFKFEHYWNNHVSNSSWNSRSDSICSILWNLVYMTLTIDHQYFMLFQEGTSTSRNLKLRQKLSNRLFQIWSKIQMSKPMILFGNEVRCSNVILNNDIRSWSRVGTIGQFFVNFVKSG